MKKRRKMYKKEPLCIWRPALHLYSNKHSDCNNSSSFWLTCWLIFDITFRAVSYPSHCSSLPNKKSKFVFHKYSTSRSEGVSTGVCFSKDLSAFFIVRSCQSVSIAGSNVQSRESYQTRHFKVYFTRSLHLLIGGVCFEVALFTQSKRDNLQL